MKNVIFMMAVPKNGITPAEYHLSYDAWSKWGKKFDAHTLVLSQEIVPTSEMHIIWQRYYLFDLLDEAGYHPENILIVDSDTLPHPDCPNLFEMAEGKYAAIHDDGSYDWILRGMEHYSAPGSIFDGEWFDFYEYVNSGLQIVNQSHREFFRQMLELYNTHKTEIQRIQSTYGIGTDQTPLNFMLRRHEIDMKILPYSYNMTCMGKKEILDLDLSFIDCGYVYHFNGIPNKESAVYYWMEKTHDALWRD